MLYVYSTYRLVPFRILRRVCRLWSCSSYKHCKAYNRRQPRPVGKNDETTLPHPLMFVMVRPLGEPSVEYTTMRKILILLALAILTVSSTGCSRCRGLFRRGSPCGGTRLATPPMLGGAIPLGNPIGLRQALPRAMISQPAAPMCCEPCPTDCVPCESGYIGGQNGYSGDCGCQTDSGEYFGGYVEGGVPQGYEGSVIPEGTVIQGSGTYPSPKN